MSRRGAAFPGSSNIVWVSGVIDANDPTESDGSPKLLDDATVEWQLRTAQFPAGVLIGAGSGVWNSALGMFRCELSHSLSFSAANSYWLHVVVTSTDGFVAMLDDSFEAITRTGRTPTT